jgi:hypothetical protein
MDPALSQSSSGRACMGPQFCQVGIETSVYGPVYLEHQKVLLIGKVPCNAFSATGRLSQWPIEPGGSTRENAIPSPRPGWIQSAARLVEMSWCWKCRFPLRSGGTVIALRECEQYNIKISHWGCTCKARFKLWAIKQVLES